MRSQNKFCNQRNQDEALMSSNERILKPESIQFKVFNSGCLAPEKQDNHCILTFF